MVPGRASVQRAPREVGPWRRVACRKVPGNRKFLARLRFSCRSLLWRREVGLQGRGEGTIVMPVRPCLWMSLFESRRRPSSDAVMEGDYSMLSRDVLGQTEVYLREVLPDIGAASRIIGNTIATDCRTRARRCIADSEGICLQPSSAWTIFERMLSAGQHLDRKVLTKRGLGCLFLMIPTHSRCLDPCERTQRCAQSSPPPGLYPFL